MSLFYAKIIGEYVVGLLPIGTHSWFKFVNHKVVEEMLNNNGCVKHGLTGFKYSFLKAEWNFWSWTNCNYALHMIKCRE
jgi:2-polyprenyl-3-methyl-5-hydroxy-6-metoxy-1,4-benzoquinol methylase